ncbi:ABC transporter ATP-binding protein [Candidatus Arthromitus sp. SFB-rat-Yit]|uniref:ABC transporter ATP-binding protein n=1 Tax=Candidatus Arthromitus sp. SFB-rat-Yit TaxID=1041504 RepID=UPI000227A109|nr:ABC transporter ATP-binding protein [Candidatus Arthromitus sp. SFB-rat-Yit]BAK81331.1 ABC transporter, ATP-binding protein [Candidatus Arthromitus sp. SFB-rat-Yit]
MRKQDVGHFSEIKKSKPSKGTAKRLFGYFKPRLWILIVIIVFAIIGQVFNIVGPKIMGKAINEVFDGAIRIATGMGGIDFQFIGKIILILIVLYSLGCLFTYLQNYIMAGFGQSTMYDLRKDVDLKISRIPLNYYDTKTHGEILSRLTNDIELIATTLQENLTQFISSVITIVGVIIAMITISPIMTILTILILFIGTNLIKPLVGKSQKYFKSQQKTVGELNGYIEEMYSGHNVVKAFGREPNNVKRFDEINESLYESGWKAQFISGIIMPVMMFINNINYIIIAIIGGYFSIIGKIGIGDIQAFIQYSRQFGMPINQIASIASLFQSTLAAAERVFEFLDEEELTPESTKDARIPDVHGRVVFENVKFGYNPDKPLMNNISFEVKPGQKVAIVGHTGAGKTTLINLLMRFYDINGGSIKIDGVDINDMTRDYLRSNFGMVLQDTWLFNGTIKENLSYSLDGATDERIIESSKAAHTDDFIRLFENGYDTVLNEDASNISQGQKQLLTIARAIVADPKILILDEATSNVDTRTEALIQKAMRNLMEGRTSFVIAHRLSTIKDSDLILVMKQGNIIEHGNHDELMAQNGSYADLYNSQFEENA